ncbi:inovirus Gp2 family protein [Pseudomonas putida]|uniref:inovirus Gp2 family protein n=1 Tax=Pseudomonas TaxID=286 RepID=UPI00119869B4|nr:inovirus Gp2 family protein [Pseudomonas putida]EKT4559079.1 inovirus Gp2 family protein [Pseudomonas putida]MDP9537199.1 inovirus Gp2 family protein [Pseudomonas putida]QDY39317.1 transposase [Pseudomonas putida]
MSSLLNSSNRQLLRHPDNANIRLYHDDTFEGFPLMVEKGPFIREYLFRLRHTIELTLDQYPRMVAVRVDLRLPLDIELPDYAYTNRVISRFFESFNGKIEYHRRQLREQSRYARGCKVRYVWSREVGQGGRQHYHVLILLNRDAYYGMGRLGSGRVNMISRIEESWASALGITLDNISGLVHIPKNAEYRLNRGGQPGDTDELPALFHRASYLCKMATKSYGDRQRAFDTSRG